MLVHSCYLVVHPDSISFWQIKRGHPTCKYHYSSNENDWGKIENLIRSGHFQRFFLLIFPDDESIVQEVFPPLSQRDRKILLDRLKKKHQKNKMFSSYYSSEDNGKMIYYFYSCNNFTFVDKVIATIEKSSAAIAAVYSPAQVCTYIAQQNQCDNGILFSLHKNSLRQSIIKNTALIFTRSTVIDMQDETQFFTACCNEIQRVYAYAHSHFYNTRQQLKLCFLGSTCFGEIPASIYRDLSDSDAKLEVKIIASRSEQILTGEEIYLRNLLLISGIPQLASAALLKRDHIFIWRRYLWSSTVIMLLSAVFVGYWHNHQVELLKSKLAEVGREHREIKHQLSTTDMTQLKHTLPELAWEELARIEQAFPEQPSRVLEALINLSQVMDRHAMIELERLEWKREHGLVIRVEGYVRQLAIGNIDGLSIRRTFETFRADLEANFELEAKFSFSYHTQNNFIRHNEIAALRYQIEINLPSGQANGENDGG